MHSNTGFSLLELIIALAMMAILAAVSLPTYHHLIARAQFSDVLQATLPLKLAVSTCYQIEGGLENCSSGQHGIPAATPAGSTTNLVNTLTVVSGIITVTPKAEKGFLEKDNLILTPLDNNHQLKWVASGQAKEKGYVS